MTMGLDRQLRARDLVGLGDIAARVGVGPSAVSNWTSHNATFPEPVVRLKMGAVWDWAEVRAWLIATGRPWRVRA